MKKIRAKFKCSHIIPAVQGYDSKAYLHPVYDTDCEENKSFNSATPAGNLEIVISKDVPASKFFKEGREYYLDFIRVPKEETKP